MRHARNVTRAGPWALAAMVGIVASGGTAGGVLGRPAVAEAPRATTAGPPTTATAEHPPTSRPTDDRAALEARFKKVLEGAVLKGTWQATNTAGLAGKAPLSEPRPDRYTISGVRKFAGDHWVITARIEYGERDVNVPVPVRVVWAGDTPIMTLDKINIPLIGAYSARVMIYGHFYCGAWFGKDYGGILSGQIIRQEDEEQLEAASKAEDPPGSEPEPTAAPRRSPAPERR